MYRCMGVGGVGWVGDGWVVHVGCWVGWGGWCEVT